MNLTERSKEVHADNKAKGFWEGDRNTGECIALMHSELSEALEADRIGKWFSQAKFDDSLLDGNRGYWMRSLYEDTHGKQPTEDEIFKRHFEWYTKNTVEDELADTVIRIMDFCGAKDIDLEWHIEQKLKYNKLREHKHGKQY